MSIFAADYNTTLQETMKVKERIYHIAALSLLSIILIYMGVGLPVILLRCTTCVDRQDLPAFFVCMQPAGGGCSCGCQDTQKQKKGGCKCCCASKKGACNDSKQMASSRSARQKGGCVKVTLEKIEPSIQVSPIQLEEMDGLCCDSLFNYYYLNPCLFCVLNERDYRGSLPDRQPPRLYLAKLCTLLI